MSREKFSTKGLINVEALTAKLGDTGMAEALAKKANFGLSKQTWATYKTTINHLETCQRETGADLTLPFDSEKTLKFVGWMEARGLKSGTMSSYLSGVRMFHLACLFDEPCLREPLVKLILKGQDNYDKVKERLNGKVGRLPVTINVMKLLLIELRKVNWSLAEKRLFWAVATVAWAGSFRIHELCSRERETFSKQTTLTWGDLKLGSLKLKKEKIKSLAVHVKSPKVDRIGAGDNIEVFQLDNFMCPIAAMEKYKEVSNLEQDPDMPVFRLESGMCFTGKDMNHRLMELTGHLEGVVPGGVVRSHSFRSGVVCHMAKAGYSEEQLKTVGRWHGPSWKNYVKLPLTHRAQFAKDICLSRE